VTDIRFRVNGVSKYYRRKNQWGKKVLFPVLNQLTLDLYNHKINVLTGASGCGKTTLAKLLMRLERVDQGEIWYLHKPLHDNPEREFRRKNQMMFQWPFLSVNPCFTIKKIIIEPLQINKKHLPQTDQISVAETLSNVLELVELPLRYLHKYPGQLSGGELQRVVLARVLVLNPEFIILDEPFSALDELAAHRLGALFKQIFQHMNMGVLWITHSLQQVETLADHVITLDSGKCSGER